MTELNERIHDLRLEQAQFTYDLVSLMQDLKKAKDEIEPLLDKVQKQLYMVEWGEILMDVEQEQALFDYSQKLERELFAIRRHIKEFQAVHEVLAFH